MSEIIDLSEMDEIFDGAVVEEREFESVPDGKYKAIVDKVEITRSKTTDKPMLKWCLKIIVGGFSGRLLWRNNMMSSEANLKWLKQDLLTCGLQLGKLSDLPNRLEELIGVTLEITKKTKCENENVYLNRKIEIAAGLVDDLPF